MGNSQPVQITKETISRRLTMKVVYSIQKDKVVAGPLFANPLEGGNGRV